MTSSAWSFQIARDRAAQGLCGRYQRSGLQARQSAWMAGAFSGGKGRKQGQPYARAQIKGKQVYLHRFIVCAPDGMHVDHKNHQTLDCRRENLEVITHIENQRRRRNVLAAQKKKRKVKE